MKPPSDGTSATSPDSSRRPSSTVLAFAAAVTAIGIATATHRLHGGLFVALLLLGAGWSVVRLVTLAGRRDKPAGWWKAPIAAAVGLFVAAVITAGVIG